MSAKRDRKFGKDVTINQAINRPLCYLSQIWCTDIRQWGGPSSRLSNISAQLYCKHRVIIVSYGDFSVRVRVCVCVADRHFLVQPGEDDTE